MRVPLVSVIIPVYNVERYLDKTIASVAGQTTQDIEIILIDDGSSDGSPSKIVAWADRDRRVTAMSKANEGVTRARIDGLHVATGEYVLFLDGDDYLEQDAIELMLDKAEVSHADVVLTDFIIHRLDGTQAVRYTADFETLECEGFLNHCYSNGDFYCMGRLIRRSFICGALEKHSIPWDITYGEDNLLVTLLALDLNVAAKIRKPVLHYVMREDSVSNRPSRHDLEMRSKAHVICCNHVSKLDCYERVKHNVASYLVGEYMAYISHGYIPEEFSRLYRQNRHLAKCLPLKTKMFCALADVSVPLSIRLYDALRRVKRTLV